MTPGPTCGPDDKTPLVSIIMANYCGGPYLAAAVDSVLSQTHTNLELIVVDDASTDDSVAILSRLSQADQRIRPILRDENAGVASARNAAIDAALGDWIAIVDSDDVLHPRRIEWLLAAVTRAGADMVADDLVPFGAPDVDGATLLESLGIDRPITVDAAALVRSDTGPRGVGSLGYLKPLIARKRIGDVRYNTQLSIGEDFDFYLRLLLGGQPMQVLPLPLYLYRRHSASLSHRLSEDALAAMVARNDGMLAMADGPDVAKAASNRGRDLRQALLYERLVRAIKLRSGGAVVGMLMRHPRLFGRLIESVLDRRRRVRATNTADQEEWARTVVLGTGSPLGQFNAPSDVILIDTGPLIDSTRDLAPTYRSLAGKLNLWASQGPLHLIAIGPEGRDALGFCASWDSAQFFEIDGTPGNAISPPGGS